MNKLLFKIIASSGGENPIADELVELSFVSKPNQFSGSSGRAGTREFSSPPIANRPFTSSKGETKSLRLFDELDALDVLKRKELKATGRRSSLGQ